MYDNDASGTPAQLGLRETWPEFFVHATHSSWPALFSWQIPSVTSACSPSLAAQTDATPRGLPRRAVLQPHYTVRGINTEQDTLPGVLHSLCARFAAGADGGQRWRAVCVGCSGLWLHAVLAGEPFF